jgi:hypothetical protein
MKPPRNRKLFTDYSHSKSCGNCVAHGARADFSGGRICRIKDVACAIAVGDGLAYGSDNRVVSIMKLETVL